MDELFEEYNDSLGKQQGIVNMDLLMQNFVSKVFNSMDEELYELQSMVEDGEHSTKEIAYKIDDIRKKIY